MNLSFMIVLKVHWIQKMVKLLNHCVSFLADDDHGVILKYNKIWNKKILKNFLVLNLIVSLLMKKNTLKPQ